MRSVLPACIAYLVALAFVACDGNGPANVDPPSRTPDQRSEGSPEPGTPPPPADPFEGDAEVIARDLEVPWDIAFVEHDVLLVTERPGRVRAIRDGELEDEPVATLEVAARGEGGLHGVAVDPDWPERPRIYLYYTHPEGSNRVSAFEVDDPEGEFDLGDEQVLLRGIPASSNHNGGRIDFGPDGFLYVTTGDAGDPARSADVDSLGGKILRIDRHGDPAPDNPFGGSAVWAYGVRNPQGIAWDEEGRLYASDHGPSGEFGLCCRDELNLVAKGSFQGWPFRSGGEATGVGEPPDDWVEPVAESGEDTWAPGGIAYLELEGEPSILMANLRGAQLRRFTLAPDDPRTVEDQEVVVDGYGRLRDVAIGPAGCVYVLTSNRDGRGDPAARDDRVLRFCG